VRHVVDHENGRVHRGNLAAAVAAMMQVGRYPNYLHGPDWFVHSLPAHPHTRDVATAIPQAKRHNVYPCS
jgi:hypothetical protein